MHEMRRAIQKVPHAKSACGAPRDLLFDDAKMEMSVGLCFGDGAADGSERGVVAELHFTVTDRDAQLIPEHCEVGVDGLVFPLMIKRD